MKRFGSWRYIACGIALLATSSFGVSQQDAPPRKIEITAMRFSYHPNEITLKRGEPVVLVIHSTDVTHGLEIKGLGVKVDIPNGRLTEVPLTPTDAGDFDGQCSHFCGEDHGSMTFIVHVVE